MGIDNFNTWLKSKYPSCLQNIKSNLIYDYIYIDLNHILHYDIRKSENCGELKNNIFKSLDIIFSNFIASKGIIITIDGPSPYAKVILQKERRSQGLLSDNSEITSEMDPINLTPGTSLMKKIDSYIFQYGKEIKKRNYFLKPEFILVPASKYGEGEVKIFEKMREILKDNTKSTNLVIGNDADIIVLGMATSPFYNINILMRHNSELCLISIKDLLREQGKSLLNNGKISYLKKNNIRNDFVILSILNGNDYLPKLKYIKFDILWETYNKFIEMNNFFENNCNLIKNNYFDNEALITFFRYLLNNLAKRYTKFNYDKYNEEDIEKYLEGLLWCLNMYQTGKCSMYEFIFDRPSPTPINVYMYLISNREKKIDIPNSTTVPLSCEYYPLLLMPYKAKKIIPKKYHKYMDNDLKYLYEKEKCILCKDLYDSMDEENKNDVLKKIKKHNKEKHSYKFNINDIKKIIDISKK